MSQNWDNTATDLRNRRNRLKENLEVLQGMERLESADTAFWSVDDAVRRFLSFTGYYLVGEGDSIDLRLEDSQLGNSQRQAALTGGYNLGEYAYRLASKIFKVFEEFSQNPEKVRNIINVLYGMNPKNAVKVLESISDLVSLGAKYDGGRNLAVVEYILDKALPIVAVASGENRKRLESLVEYPNAHKKHTNLFSNAYSAAFGIFLEDIARTMQNPEGQYSQIEKKVMVFSPLREPSFSLSPEDILAFAKAHAPEDALNRFESQYACVVVGLKWNSQRGSPNKKIGVVVTIDGLTAVPVEATFRGSQSQQAKDFFLQIGKTTGHIKVAPYTDFHSHTQKAVINIQNYI